MPTLEQLANSYSSAPELTLTDQDIADLSMFIMREYQHLRNVGIDVVLSDVDPYDGYNQMRQDVLLNGRLKVYIGGTDSPILSHHLNVMFRAVHDYHHVLVNADFTLEGEVRAFCHIASLLHNPRLIQVMFSEIVLQAATCIHTGNFPEQRIVDSPLVAHFSPGGQS